MWLVVRTASRTWTGCCIAGACCQCGQQFVQRVVCGLDAALLAHDAGVVGSPYSECGDLGLNRVLALQTK